MSITPRRPKEIADKYQAAIGYDYDKALEKCRKKQAKKKDTEASDVGGEALGIDVALMNGVMFAFLPYRIFQRKG